jgi:hypothetical protein
MKDIFARLKFYPRAKISENLQGFKRQSGEKVGLSQNLQVFF